MSKKVFKRKDRFYNKAKEEGFVARSAYKIIEFDKKYKIFSHNLAVIDLGAAPGGWLQVAQKKMKNTGTLIGIDKLDLKISLSPYLHFLKDDFLAESAQDWLIQKSPNGADWVLSDIAPNLTGIKFQDQTHMDEICYQIFEFSKKVLKQNGSMLFKFFPSPAIDDLQKQLKASFQKVEKVKPEATRGSSNEFYMVCLNFKKE